jgi:hypothetical protein
MAQQQLQSWLTTKAEGHSILNYNLANKQYLDALSLGSLLGVDTSRVRPYGGESHNTVNVIGTDAIDGIARRVAEQTTQQRPVQTQTQPSRVDPQPPREPQDTSQTEGGAAPATGAPADGGQQTDGTDPAGAEPPKKRGRLFRNLVVGTGLVLSGVSIPLLVGALTGDDEEQVEQQEQDQGTVVPWRTDGKGESKVEVDVY